MSQATLTEGSVVPNFRRLSQVAALTALGLCVALPAGPQTLPPRCTQQIEPGADAEQANSSDVKRQRGLWFLDGRQGVPQDFACAFHWLREAANDGDAAAQNNLGLMYLNGQGVLPNPQTAVKWFRQAAEQEDTGAQFNLALSYETGRGVDQDYTVAAEWYRRAADGGEPAAQKNLGIMYFLGQGVQRDFVAAHTWLNLAAAQGDAGARGTRELVAKSMTIEEIVDAQSRATMLAATPGLLAATPGR